MFVDLSEGLCWSMSALVVNESKTEVCLFHKNDQCNVKIKICGTQIISKSSINVLGVTFDSKLNWSVHIANAISKAKKSLYALRQIKPFFTKSQMRTLIDSYFYSVLYYNSSVWLSPDINLRRFRVMHRFTPPIR